jgi:predicted transcriptional regulator of viral defense system
MWRKQAKERMQKDLGSRFDDYLACKLPLMRRFNLHKIGSTAVQFHERSQLGAFRLVPDSPLRVATVGRVFLDMVREPGLCGGIQHVVDVFMTEAKRHQRLIVDEVERNGTAIDKVRTGYLLSEICKLDDSVVEKWTQLAQRGGSRKLDPEAEYMAYFSEKWHLSINVPSLMPSALSGDE